MFVFYDSPRDSTTATYLLRAVRRHARPRPVMWQTKLRMPARSSLAAEATAWYQNRG